jgi:hypothetical protein
MAGLNKGYFFFFFYRKFGYSCLRSSLLGVYLLFNCICACVRVRLKS